MPDRCAFHHRFPSGDEDKRNGGGVLKGDTVGNPDKAVDRHDSMKGIGASSATDPTVAETNPVPRCEPRGSSADGLNDARAVMTQHTAFRSADVGPQTAEERIRWIHARCDKPH